MTPLLRRRLADLLRRRAGGFFAAFLVLVAVAGAAAPARAQACTASGPTLTFGTVNPFSGYPYTTSGNTTLSCTAGIIGFTAYACLSVGTGSGGTTATNRTLASGGSTLPIQITGGSSYPSQTGNGTSYPMEGLFTVTVAANSSGSTMIPIAVNIPQPSSAPPPGSYSSSFTGTDAQIFYVIPILQIIGVPSSCAGLASGAHYTTQANFSIGATVPVMCTVTASSLAFPTASVLTHSVSATATITSTCNAVTAVTIALDNGATGSGPTTRQMKFGSNAITYGIYRDSGATQPWGSIAGTNTGSISNGTGSLTAYGLVPAQSSAAPGNYADVVNVTITY